MLLCNIHRAELLFHVMAGEKNLNNSRQQGSSSKAKMGLTKKDAYLSNWNKALLRDEGTTKSHNVSRQSCTVADLTIYLKSIWITYFMPWIW